MEKFGGGGGKGEIQRENTEKHRGTRGKHDKGCELRLGGDKPSKT